MLTWMKKNVNQLLGNVFPDTDSDLVGTWETEDLQGQRSINVIQVYMSNGTAKLIDGSTIKIDELITKWKKVEDIESPFANPTLAQFSDLRIDQPETVQPLTVTDTPFVFDQHTEVLHSNRVDYVVREDSKPPTDPKLVLFQAAFELSNKNEQYVIDTPASSLTTNVDVEKLKQLVVAFDIPLELCVSYLMESQSGKALISDLLTNLFKQ